MTGRLIASARGLFAESGSFRFLSLLTAACTVLWVFAMIGGGGGGVSGPGGSGQPSASSGGSPQSPTAPAGSSGNAPSYATQAAPAAPVSTTGQAYNFSAPTKVPPPAPAHIHAPVLIDPANPKSAPGTAEPMLQGMSFNELKS